jgi:ABC-type antimicrobial peptide transport system permease subunit
MNMATKSPKPPGLILRLLRALARPEEKFPLAGDLEEEYHSRLAKNGRLKADVWFWWQAFRTILPILFHRFYWSTALMVSYFSLAGRKIRREKIVSLINITGLAVGITCFILIVLWVRDEFSFDRFHKNADLVHQVLADHEFSSGRLLGATTPAPLAPALREEYPEIEAAVRLFPAPRILIRQKDYLFYEEDGLLVSPSFFDVFSVEFIRGDPDTALDDLFSIVLTEEMAEKYFGREDPMGKTLRAENILDLEVTGIMRKMPPNSHLQFRYLMPFQIVKIAGGSIDRWDENAFFTYVRLAEGASPSHIQVKMEGFIKKHHPSAVTSLKLQPLTRIHLHSHAEGDIARLGDIRYVYIFTTVALFVLFIACINFMNLSTARAGDRAQEVGMRKVIGAQRFDLRRQFLGESVMTSFLALILAFWFISLLLPAFNRFSGKALSIDPIQESWLWLVLAGVALLTGLLAGSYPALVLSSFLPARVLKGVFTLSGRGTAFRRILVVLQFALSIFLLISTSIIHHQIEYIRQRKLGYEKENVLYFRLGRNPERYYAQIKDRLMTRPEVLGITTANLLPTYVINSTADVSWPGKNPDDLILFHELRVGYDYFKTLGIKMIAGRTFSPDYPADQKESFIVNQKAAALISRDLPLESPLTVYNQKGRIIGIVQDFHFRSLNHEIKPLLITCNPPSMFDYLMIRISGQNIPAALEALEGDWKGVAKDWPFEFSFLEREFDVLYRSESRMAGLFDSFTLLSVFIACFGLFGLAVYFSRQRTKEIGIRKVLGATVWEIYRLLSREYIRWVLIANVIAWPAAFLFMRRWLKNFAYQAHFPVGAFFWSTLWLVLIALGTVSFQAIKAARSNPVDSLRNE